MQIKSNGKNILFLILFVFMFEFVQSQEKNEAFLPFQDVISYDNGKMILEISELINLDSFQEKTFTFYIPLSHTIKEIKNLEFDSAVILNAEIIQVNQSYALKMVCHFPPNAETQLARALYSLGVQQISMKGKMVSILDFARYYHAMEKNHFQKNRNAIKN